MKKNKIVALPFEGHDLKWDASDYKKRNYHMVDHADFLLAVSDNHRKIRSGTGQTVNYALKQNLRILFLHPDTAESSESFASFIKNFQRNCCITVGCLL